MALYARTLGWPALEIADAELRAAASLAEAARAGGAGGVTLFLEGLGDSAFVARAVTLLLHAGASALAFALARTLGVRRVASTLVALLFAVHPLQVESVAWLSQRDTLLGGFCFLLGARLVLGAGALRSCVGAGALMLALLAEPRLVGGIAWLALAERWSLPRPRGRLRLALDLALVALASGSLFLWLSGERAADAHAFLSRCAQVPRALAALAWHALAPAGLTPHHGLPSAQYWTLVLEWLALGLVLTGVARLRSRRPLAALGVLLFVLLGAGGVLFPRSADLFRESDAYLGILGLALVLVSASERFVRPALALGAGFVLASAARTHVGLGHWRSEFALQEAALAVRPDDAQAHAALGHWHLLHGRVSAAQAACERALALRPSDPAALVTLGEIELRRAGVPGEEQHLARARELFERSQRSAWTPALAAARERLAEIHQLAGEPEPARLLLEELLRTEPERVATHVRLGRLQLERRELADARRAFERAAELDPRASEAWSGLGIVAFQENRSAEARDFFERALALEPDLIEASALLGRLHEQRAAPAEAERFYRRALSLAPDRTDTLQVDTLYALGALLSAAERGDEALRYLERVVELRPEPPHVRAHLESARLRLARGESETARRLLAPVLVFNPGHAEARALLEQIEQTGAPR